MINNMNQSGFIKLWGIPLLLAIISLIGLIAALVGDGFLDFISWIGLGYPLVIIVWFLIKRQ